MKREVQNKKVLIRGKEVFIGVDVHKESWHVTARVEEEELFHGGIPSQYHALRMLFVQFKDCRSRLPMRQVLVGSGYMTDLLKMQIQRQGHKGPCLSCGCLLPEIFDSRRIARLLNTLGVMLQTVSGWSHNPTSGNPQKDNFHNCQPLT